MRQYTIANLPIGWVHLHQTEPVLTVSHLLTHGGTPTVHITVTVKEDYAYSVHMYSNLALSGKFSTCDKANAINLINEVMSKKMCKGTDEIEFIQLLGKKGKFTDKSGKHEFQQKDINLNAFYNPKAISFC